MRRVMCLAMPFLGVEQAMQSSGAPAHEPVALVAHVDSCPRIVCCNSPARRGGVATHMPLTEARAVLPGLHAVPHEPDGERRVLESLASWAHCFSPVVQPDPPDALLVDVTGCERLFRGESTLLGMAIAGLRAQGFTTFGVIAGTVGAAWALAHGQSSPLVVGEEETTTVIRTLPPWTLRLDPREASLLEAVGVDRIEALLHLPRSSIAARMGEGVLRRLDQALGAEPEWLEAFDPPAKPVSRIRFAGVTDRLEVIHEAIERLAMFFCEQLTASGSGVRQVRCTFYFEQAPPMTLSLGLSRMTRSPRHLASLLATRLEATPLPAAVLAMMVWTPRTEPFDHQQLELFEPHPLENDAIVAGLSDRLVMRLGVESVRRAVLVADHQPEYAYQTLPVADACHSERSEESSRRAVGSKIPRSARNDRDAGNGCPILSERKGGDSRTRTESPTLCFAKDGAPARKIPRFARNDRDVGFVEARPLRLLARPVVVPAMSVVPDGPPTWFRWDGVEQVIVDAAGPERIETGWWRNDDIQRDYYRVTTEAGQQFWLFRDRSDGRWYVQGSYE